MRIIVYVQPFTLTQRIEGFDKSGEKILAINSTIKEIPRDIIKHCRDIDSVLLVGPKMFTVKIKNKLYKYDKTIKVEEQDEVSDFRN